MRVSSLDSIVKTLENYLSAGIIAASVLLPMQAKAEEKGESGHLELCDTPKDCHVEGKEHYRQYEYQGALDAWQRALVRVSGGTTDRALILSNIASAYWCLRQPEKAVETYSDYRDERDRLDQLDQEGRLSEEESVKNQRLSDVLDDARIEERLGVLGIYVEGKRLFEEGNSLGAVELYRRASTEAFTQDLRIALIFDTAEAYRLADQEEDAWEKYRQFLSEDAANVGDRPTAERWYHELGVRLGKIEEEISLPEEGQPELVGTETPAEDYVQPASFLKRNQWPLVTAGSGAAAVITGLILDAVTDGKFRDNNCAESQADCPPSMQDELNTRYNAASGLVIGGGAAAAAGIGWLLWNEFISPKPESGSGAGVSPSGEVYWRMDF